MKDFFINNNPGSLYCIKNYTNYSLYQSEGQEDIKLEIHLQKCELKDHCANDNLIENYFANTPAFLLFEDYSINLFK